MKYEVLVQLKGEVLDPEGRAIQETLKSQGFHSVASVQVAKRYVLDIPGDADQSEKIATEISQKYLANPVAQTFSVKRLPS
jgi:phosphoribosylformylglycinamidine synthase PurS subunit